MLRFYTRFAFMLTVLFVMCGTALIGFGSTQPINPALRGFVEGCDQLCWFGIIPNVTTLDEAQQILEENGYTLSTLGQNPVYIQAVHQVSDYCYATISNSSRSDNIVSTISLFNCHVTLGDVLAILGTPSSITTCIYQGNYQVDFHLGQMATLKDFSEIPPSAAISLYQSIELIILFGGERSEGYWYSLIPLWRYNQFALQPFIYPCF